MTRVPAGSNRNGPSPGCRAEVVSRFVRVRPAGNQMTVGADWDRGFNQTVPSLTLEGGGRDGPIPGATESESVRLWCVNVLNLTALAVTCAAAGIAAHVLAAVQCVAVATVAPASAVAPCAAAVVQAARWVVVAQRVAMVAAVGPVVAVEAVVVVARAEVVVAAAANSQV